VAGKAKTWVQMLGIGFVVLVSTLPEGRDCAIVFAVPLAAALIAMAAVRLSPRRRFRPLEFAAAVLVVFLASALLGGAPAAKVTVLGFVILITWYSAFDYLAVGLPEVLRPDPRRLLHWLRLVAGAILPVIALGAIATDRLPAIGIIVLVSSDMARGALDNFVANRGVADFSWAGSLWAEVALLGLAMVFPSAGTALTTVAVLIGVTETLRALGRHLRRPADPTSITVPASPASTTSVSSTGRGRS
jgi:hypothetical protein